MCDEFLVHAADVEGLCTVSIWNWWSAWAGVTASHDLRRRGQFIADLEDVARAGGGKINLTIGSALDILRLISAFTTMWSRWIANWKKKENQNEIQIHSRLFLAQRSCCVLMILRHFHQFQPPGAQRGTEQKADDSKKTRRRKRKQACQRQDKEPKDELRKRRIPSIKALT